MFIPNKTHILFENIKNTPDFKRLEKIVESFSEETWLENNIRQFRDSVNNHTQSVIYKHNNNDHVFTVNEDTVYFNEVIEIVNRIIKTHQVLRFKEPKSLLFARLPAGKCISEHIDIAPFHGTCKRFHIVISTNPEVNFKIDNKNHHFKKGDVVEINNKLKHGVYNNGKSDRVHLIVDF